MIDIRLISLIVCSAVFGDNQLIRSGITGGSPGLAEHHNAQKYKIEKYKNTKYKIKNTQQIQKYKIQSINKIKD